MMNERLEKLTNAVVKHIWEKVHPGEPLVEMVAEKPEYAYYWGGKGKYQEAYNQLFKELVPTMGEAETLEGKALRRTSKTYYRLYNDGDEIHEAFWRDFEAYLKGTLTEFSREYYALYPGSICGHCGKVKDEDCECEHCYCCGEHEYDCQCGNNREEEEEEEE